MKNLLLVTIGVLFLQRANAGPISFPPQQLNCAVRLDAIADHNAQGASLLPDQFNLQMIRLSNGQQDSYGNFDNEIYKVTLSEQMYRVPNTFEIQVDINRIERRNSGKYISFYRFEGGLNQYMLNPSVSIDINLGEASNNRWGHIRIENAAGLKAFYHFQCGQIR